MSTRWTLSVALFLLLAGSTAFAAAGEDVTIVAVEQGQDASTIQVGSGNEVVIQYGDPDDLITGNRGTGITGGDQSNGSSVSWDIEDDTVSLFVTLCQMLIIVP